MLKHPIKRDCPERIHLVEVTPLLLFEVNVPKFLWGKAVLTAAHLINQLPSRVLGNKSPIHRLSKIFLDLVSIKDLPLEYLDALRMFIDISNIVQN